MSKELELREVQTNGVLRVANYEETCNLIQEVIQDLNLPEVITSEEEKKVLKAKRAQLNKVIKAIENRRISIVADFTRVFQNECKGIVQLLDNAQNSIKELLDAYQKQEDGNKETKIFATTRVCVEITDSEIFKKFITFCEKNKVRIINLGE